MRLDTDSINWLKTEFGAAVTFEEPMAGHTYFHRMEEVLTTCLGPADRSSQRQMEARDRGAIQASEAVDLMLERLASA